MTRAERSERASKLRQQIEYSTQRIAHFQDMIAEHERERGRALVDLSNVCHPDPGVDLAWQLSE